MTDTHLETSTDLSRGDSECYRICEISFEDLTRDHSYGAEKLAQLRAEYDAENVRVIIAYYNSILANPKLPLRFLRKWLDHAKSHGVVSDELQKIESEMPALQKNELIAILEIWKALDSEGTHFRTILLQMCDGAIKNGMSEVTVGEIQTIFSDSEVTTAGVMGAVKAKIDFPVPDTLSPKERFKRILDNRDRSKHPPVERISEAEMRKMWKKKINAAEEGKPHGDLSAE